MSGDEVGMKVREKHSADLETVLRRGLDIDSDVTPGIDDDRGPAAGITDEIRRVSQTPQVILFENHRSRDTVNRWRSVPNRISRSSTRRSSSWAAASHRLRVHRACEKSQR